jgi:hypothetical protein
MKSALKKGVGIFGLQPLTMSEQSHSTLDVPLPLSIPTLRCYSYIHMAVIDIVSLILSFGIIFSLRFVFPRNIVPLVSASLDEAEATLERAEAVNIPNVSEYQEKMAKYACLYPVGRLPSY